MPALRMKRKFDDDGFGNEFDTNSKYMISMKISHFQIGELEQSPVVNSSYKDPQDEPDLITQLAGQDIRIMEASGFHDMLGETSIALLKVYLQAYEELLVIALLLQLVMCALFQESASYGHIVGHFI